MRTVVPDHRKVPLIAGLMVIKGAVTVSGIRPSTTIGSENMIQISLASARLAVSSIGPPLTTVRLPGNCCA
jgi:hypothetical protein